MTQNGATLVHATAVAIDGHGLLLTGISGSGKSDLALRLIDRGATLVGDDGILISVRNGVPILTAGPNIEGLIEVRGVGILPTAHISEMPLRVVIELDKSGERLPAENATQNLAGFNVPSFCLNACEQSACIKAELALKSVVDADRWPMASRTIQTVTESELR